jgi:hypothetical protein
LRGGGLGDTSDVAGSRRCGVMGSVTQVTWQGRVVAGWWLNDGAMGVVVRRGGWGLLSLVNLGDVAAATWTHHRVQRVRGVWGGVLTLALFNGRCHRQR